MTCEVRFGGLLRTKSGWKFFLKMFASISENGKGKISRWVFKEIFINCVLVALYLRRALLDFSKEFFTRV